MEISIEEGNPNEPLRVLIYGVEGVGKSTLGAKADNPIFLSPEGGTNRLKDSSGNGVKNMKGIKTWDALLANLEWLLNKPHSFKTLVLDSADWIEGLAHTKIIGKSNKTIVTCNGGYGAGYRESQNMHQALITLLSEIREKRGMHIVITAHSHVKDVKDPESPDDYQASEIKCHEFVSSIWREWVEGLFFARFRTYMKTAEDAGTKVGRAFGDDTRVVYTVKRPAFQAKNRYNMPPEMDFTENFWNELKAYAYSAPKATEDSTEQLLEEIKALLVNVEDEKTREKIKAAVEKDKDSAAKLVKHKNRISELTGASA